LISIGVRLDFLETVVVETAVKDGGGDDIGGCDLDDRLFDSK
jgi:hypothetical protein